MIRRFSLLAVVAMSLSLYPGLQAQNKDKPKDKAKAGGKTQEIVIYAKKSKKLSARLMAVKMSGGTVVGMVKGNGCVIKVAANKATTVKAKFKSVGIMTKAKKPAKVKPVVEDLVLKYKKAPNATAMAKMGLRILDRHQVPGGVLLRVKPTKPLDAALVEKLEKEADLDHAEMNKKLSLPRPIAKLIKKLIEKLRSSPNDPHYTKLWGMKNINAPKAWTKGNSAKSIIVAVIDTGVDLNHEDLKAHLVKGFNAIDPKKSPQDDNGHGTHCAGTIGAIGNNKKGVVGVCWNVKIMPCKFMDANGEGSVFDAIQCIDFACKNGAKVLSNSWGGGSESQALDEAIARANKAGAVFVAAAGNEGVDNDESPSYPASSKGAHVITVAAIDSADKVATFSNFGKTSVHIAAPGVGIYSTLPKKGPLGNSTGYGYLDGTSMAAPHVAGAAALILGRPKYAKLKPAEVVNLLKKNGRKLSVLGDKCTTGATLNLNFLAK